MTKTTVFTMVLAKCHFRGVGAYRRRPDTLKASFWPPFGRRNRSVQDNVATLSRLGGPPGPTRAAPEPHSAAPEASRTPKMTFPEPPGEFQLFPGGPGGVPEPKIAEKRGQGRDKHEPQNSKICGHSVLSIRLQCHREPEAEYHKSCRGALPLRNKKATIACLFSSATPCPAARKYPLVTPLQDPTKADLQIKKQTAAAGAA